MLRTTTDDDLAGQLLRIAREPDLRRSIYERLGDYCHQCRNRLNSLKLSLYLAMKLSPSEDPVAWAEVDRHYQELERRVNQVQTLCRPMSLSRVTLGLDLLMEDRRGAWTRAMESGGGSLEFVAPDDRAVASFDVERLGQALDCLVDWRASEPGAADPARLRWWVDASHAHLVWEESLPDLPPQADGPRGDGPTWALPLLARVVLAHEGDYRVDDDLGWKLEVWWPSPFPAA